jgi:hypothetical protein
MCVSRIIQLCKRRFEYKGVGNRERGTVKRIDLSEFSVFFQERDIERLKKVFGIGKSTSCMVLIENSCSYSFGRHRLLRLWIACGDETTS